MTNQEWLQQNNAKIEEIKQLLEDKVIIAAGESKVVDIEMPENFATATTIYTYRVNRNTILFASSASYSGIWRYNAKDKSLKQLWIGGHGWQAFYSITDNLVIISTNVGPNNLVVYDIEADEITSTGLYYTGGSMNIKKIDDNRFFISTSTSISKGLAIFDVRTKMVKTIRSISYNYTYFAQMGDYWFIASNTGQDGLLKFNALTEEITMVHGNGRWFYLYAIDDKCYFSGDSSSSKGLYVYDNSTETVTTIDADNYGWAYVFNIGDKIYVSNSQSSVAGIYEIVDNQLVQVYAEGYDYRHAPTINDRAIITGSPSFALIFDTTDGSFTKVENSNAKRLGNSIVLGNKMLLTPTTTSSSKLFVYDYDANTLTQNSSSLSFSNYGTFKQDGDNCYISNPSANTRILYYTNADDSVKVVGYRMEV